MDYTYPAQGTNSVRPHAVQTTGNVWQYTYDTNDNLVAGGNRTYGWNTDNQPQSITGPDGVTETYGYDAEGNCVVRTRSGLTTLYVGGLLEEDLETGTTRTLVQVAGQVVAQRTITNGVHSARYLHNDHLGSVALGTDGAQPVVVQQQQFGPWGEVRAGGITDTTLNYTGQRKDGTGCCSTMRGIMTRNSRGLTSVDKVLAVALFEE